MKASSHLEAERGNGVRRVVISQHKTRAAARASRAKWKRWQRQAEEGSVPALTRLMDRHVGFAGSFIVEAGGRVGREEWIVLYG